MSCCAYEAATLVGKVAACNSEVPRLVGTDMADEVLAAEFAAAVAVGSVWLLVGEVLLAEEGPAKAVESVWLMSISCCS
jgi:hypothetical protein